MRGGLLCGKTRAAYPGGGVAWRKHHGSVRVAAGRARGDAPAAFAGNGLPRGRRVAEAILFLCRWVTPFLILTILLHGLGVF